MPKLDDKTKTIFIISTEIFVALAFVLTFSIILTMSNAESPGLPVDPSVALGGATVSAVVAFVTISFVFLLVYKMAQKRVIRRSKRQKFIRSAKNR